MEDKGDITNITDELRSFCYMFDNVNDYIQEQLAVFVTFIETGSSSECCGRYNDIDRMIVSKDFKVVENVKQIPGGYEGCILLMDTQGCNEGYTRLKLHQSHVEESKNMCLFTKLNGESYLNTKSFVRYIIEKYENIGNRTRVFEHGPAMALEGDNFRKDLDMVASIECNFLPQRVSKIKIDGIFGPQSPLRCHVVPVAHAFSKKPDLEFRLSFSVAEKRLIQTWTLKQIKCFGLCKSICKIINLRVHAKAISSYLIKTAMFWFIEETTTVFWEETELTDCVKKLLAKLIIHFRDATLPSYFIPEYNLLSTFTAHDLDQILKYLPRDDVEDFEQVLHEFKLNKEFNVIQKITEKVSFTERCKGYIFDFLRSVLNMYSQNSSKVVNSKKLEPIIAEIDDLLPNSLIKETMLMVLYRSLAYYKVYDAFETENPTEMSRLLSSAQIYFEETLELPSEMITDNGVTGFVNLAFFHFICGESNIALEYIVKALSRRKKTPDFIWRLACVPVIIPAGRFGVIPRYIEKDPLGKSMQEHVQNSAPFFDPISFAVYLFYRVTGSIDPSIFIDMLPLDLNNQGLGGSLILYAIMERENVDNLSRFLSTFEYSFQAGKIYEQWTLDYQKFLLSSDIIGDYFDILTRIFPGAIICNDNICSIISMTTFWATFVGKNFFEMLDRLLMLSNIARIDCAKVEFFHNFFVIAQDYD